MKRVYYLLSFVLFAMIVAQILYSFGLLESNTTKVVENGLGKWTILVNDTNVTGVPVDFDIDEINYISDAGVKSGKIAPGVGGYFEIAIDPTDTEVSVRYDITFDISNLEDTDTTLNISTVAETSGKTIIQTDENTYTGVITLSEIANEKVDTIRATVSWPNVEANNENDYEVGKTANATVEIPVTVTLTQYVGEHIEEYEGE